MAPVRNADMTKLDELANLGQSIWFDYIRRSFMTSGDLQALIDEGLRGITSNPTIFEKAIAGSNDYDEDLNRLTGEGKSVEEIYEALTLDDIRRAADLLRPVYERTEGGDGYVSLEVNPGLAHDTGGTIAEAKRLFAELDRPNIMIKVPATSAGIPAIRTLIGDGVNVNVTLLFSLTQYEAVAEAYMAGLEKRFASGEDVSRIASVASFFVSRVDTVVDGMLEGMGSRAALSLQGEIAVANAKVAYARFRQIFGGERWKALTQHGARTQRVLWASTGTKNPLSPDTLYVDSLIGPDTVNTVPPATLNAFRDHGEVAPTLEVGLDEARDQLAHLADLGVDLDAITRKLQDDGVAKFSESFESLMETIAGKRERLLAGWQHQAFSLGSHQAAVDRTLARMEEARVIARIWDHDHTVWKPRPLEITDRLGWMDSAEIMLDSVPRMEELAAALSSAGYDHGLLLGMGGSSLAPEVFRRTFGVKEGHVDLAVLDSIDPGAVMAHAERLDPTRAVFVIATKSGGTVETLSLFKFFYNWVVDAVGVEKAGEHFVAITDPGTRLVDLAERHGFRAIFLNDPNIGGRYSALSYFGLVPAALVGVDVAKLLNGALAARGGAEPCVAVGDNPGARLGVVLGELANVGRDKLTLAISPAIASFGDWVEQLIAESTGKEGKGILPVVGEPLGPPDVYGDDRLFVQLRLGDDETHGGALAVLEEAAHPVVRLRLRELYDLGEQLFLWEMATAVAGHRLDINPFDQPNVEAAKVLARRMVAEYVENGTLPGGEPAPLTGEALNAFLARVQLGDYIALQAYVRPTIEIACRRFPGRRFDLPETATSTFQ